MKWFYLSLFFWSSLSAATHVIHEIPPGGVVINSPGTYIFDNNLRWNPNADGQAILITSSNVTLDMNDFKLQSKSTSFNTIGIVATSVVNLSIVNGTIKNMALGGIKCQSCQNISIKNVTVDGLNRKNTATYTVPAGILISSSTNATVEKCTVKNVDVRTGSVAAIQMTETIASKISHCLVKDMLNRDGACTGIGHLLCETALVTSCKIHNLQSQFINNLNTEGHTAIGIVPVATAGLIIESCKISNIIGCCDDAHGMSLFECVGAIVKDCEVKNVLDGAGAAQTGAKATGIEIYASGVEVTDCSVKNIMAINPQDKQATGFSCAQCVGVAFVGCKAKNVQVFDQNGRQSAALGYGTGFGWAPDPRPEFVEPAVGILYRNCKAEDCQVGFDTWFHIDSIWVDIYSKCNKIPILNQPSSQRTLSCNPCSECGCLQAGCYPTPLVVTIDNVASNNTFLEVKTKVCN